MLRSDAKHYFKLSCGQQGVCDVIVAFALSSETEDERAIYLDNRFIRDRNTTMFHAILERYAIAVGQGE